MCEPIKPAPPPTQILAPSPGGRVNVRSSDVMLLYLDLSWLNGGCINFFDCSASGKLWLPAMMPKDFGAGAGWCVLKIANKKISKGVVTEKQKVLSHGEIH